MDQKVLFLSDYLREVHSFTELCRNYDISRKTGYKWVERYLEHGPEGLKERRRTPQNNPLKTAHTIRKEIIALRKRGQIRLGPKKIQSLLLRKYDENDIPSKTTIYNILRDEGLIKPRKGKKRVPRFPRPFDPVKDPNDVWTVDFKGQFLTRDKAWCYPLTVMDHQSRYLLGCRGLGQIKTADVRRELEIIFREYGLPNRIRTDNGVPFASHSLGGISHLSKWWIRLGILPERIKPGRPQENGIHERMHRTLKDAAIQPPGRTRNHQQKLFDEFQAEYNEQRPHEALGQKTPASEYRKSSRSMPKHLPELEYPGHYRTARVISQGTVYCFGCMIYVGHVITGETVGMEEVKDGIWDVYFGPIRLGYFDLRDKSKNIYGYCSLKV